MSMDTSISRYVNWFISWSIILVDCLSLKFSFFWLLTEIFQLVMVMMSCALDITLLWVSYNIALGLMSESSVLWEPGTLEMTLNSLWKLKISSISAFASDISAMSINQSLIFISLDIINTPLNKQARYECTIISNLEEGVLMDNVGLVQGFL